MTDEDDAAPSRLLDGSAYGSYGSYFNGTLGIDDRSVPRVECGCNGGGGNTDS